LGLGAKQELKDGLPKHNEISELDKLRKRLLGKKAAESSKQNTSRYKNTSSSGKDIEKNPLESDEEEEGRAITISSSKHRMISQSRMKSRNVPEESSQTDTKAQVNHVGESNQPAGISTSKNVPSQKRKGTSFLDEVLAGKRKKGKKKL
jgi:hypothetical protein